MSLINEALKRAEAEKREKLADPGAASSETAVALVAPTRRRARPLVLAAFGLALLAAVAAYFLLWNRGHSLNRAAADTLASSAPAAPAKSPAVLPAKAAPAVAPAVAVTEAPALAPSTSLRVNFGSRLNGPAEVEPAPVVAPAVAPEVEPAPAVAPAVASSEVALPWVPAPEVEPAPAVAPAAAPAAAEKPAPDEVKVDLSKFKVSSILMGPKGGSAVINGRFVREGSTIEGAKIIAITPHAVDLEISGKRFTLSM